MQRTKTRFLSVALAFLFAFSLLPAALPPAVAADDSGLLINQVFAHGNSTQGASVDYSFIELYNPSNQAVDLNGYSVQYTPVGSTWNVLALTRTIPANGSYLIRAGQASVTGAGADTPSYTLPAPDQTWDASALTQATVNNGVSSAGTISNRQFKIALVEGTTPLSVASPSEDDVVDLVGAHNNGAPVVDGALGTPFAGITRNVAIRRRAGFQNTGNNADDFREINYRASDGISNARRGYVRPRNAADGAWIPVTGDSELIINQVFAHGNSESGAAVSHSFIELYNLGLYDKDLNGYSVQYATSGDNWDVLELTGTIPARSSYLIRVGKEIVTPVDGVAPRHAIPEDAFDQEWAADNIANYTTSANGTKSDGTLSNRYYKIALVDGTDALDRFDPSAADGVLDLLGAYNSTADRELLDYALRSPQAGINRNNALRRRDKDADGNEALFRNSGDNEDDFKTVDYRLPGTDTSGNPTGTENDVYQAVKPRWSGDGVWGYDPSLIPTP